MKSPLFLRGNRLNYAVSFLLFVTFVLAGCVSSNRTELAPAAQAKFKSVAIAAAINQPEIAADVLPSNVAVATGGGLIAALIDVAVEANRSKKAENIITPLRDALVDFNAPESLREALAAELQNGNTLLPVSSVTLTGGKDEAAILKTVDSSHNDAILIVSMDYRLTPDFDRIRVLAKVRLIPATVGKDKSSPAFYQNDFATYRQLTAPASDRPSATAL